MWISVYLNIYEMHMRYNAYVFPIVSQCMCVIMHMHFILLSLVTCSKIPEPSNINAFAF